MFIKRKEYERLRKADEENAELREVERLNKELEAEVERLAELISSEVKDCKVGPWCNDCQHVGYDSAKVYDSGIFGRYVEACAGSVQYCKKHLHEICPEFEKC